jgi:hypothetical protein
MPSSKCSPIGSRTSCTVVPLLPPQYELGKRKYLLLETPDGPTVTPETDLVVFYPHYPEKLRTKESVLASGVAAAFKRDPNLWALTQHGSAGTWVNHVHGLREK